MASRAVDSRIFRPIHAAPVGRSWKKNHNYHHGHVGQVSASSIGGFETALVVVLLPVTIASALGSYLTARVGADKLGLLADTSPFILLRFLRGFLLFCRHGRSFLGLFVALLSFTHHVLSCFSLHYRNKPVRIEDYSGLATRRTTGPMIIGTTLIPTISNHPSAPGWLIFSTSLSHGR